jgi:ribosomal protein S18 acetylase RimI-like enzyme
MNEVLDNPVYRALISGDQNLSLGTEKVKYFDNNVSPFAGFEDGYDNGFGDLHDLLPDGRNILYATPEHITEPKGWQLLQKIEGLQFIFDISYNTIPLTFSPVRLDEQHIEQMMQLAKLTKPGPFGPRTIDFGHYFGIFDKEKLVAMTGQRLHVQQFTEVSAVCTHPGYLGKGYAAALIQHQLHLIRQKEQTPFLHVREDNLRAIELYKRIGFKIRGTMNFYFLKKESSH